MAVLDQRRSTSFDISAFAEEDVVKEIDLATYIQAMSITPSLEPTSLEPSAAVPSKPVTESKMTTGTQIAPPVTTVNKGKETYVPPPKKTPR